MITVTPTDQSQQSGNESTSCIAYVIFRVFFFLSECWFSLSRYPVMTRALMNAGRPIFFSLCEWYNSYISSITSVRLPCKAYDSPITELGEICTRPCGVQAWETVGEPQTTLLITGIGMIVSLMLFDALIFCIS